MHYNENSQPFPGTYWLAAKEAGYKHMQLAIKLG